MDDYISREAAILEFCDDCMDREWCKSNGESCSRIKNINAIPAADVVARDCYDRILAENDTMREMLARIGKKCGDSIDDVRPVVEAHWEWDENGMDWNLGAWTCSNCRRKAETWWANDKHNPLRCAGSHFCGNCGAEMRPYKDGRRGENDSG